MKEYVIFGTGDFADIIYDLIENSLNFNVAGFIVDDEYYSEPEYMEKPVSSLSDAKEKFPSDKYIAVVGVIGKNMYMQRENIFCKLDALGYKFDNLVHPSAVLTSCILGKGNIILEGCVIGYGAELGDGNIMWPLSSINHHGKVGSFNNIAPGATTAGGVIIGNHCFLGVNSSINNRVKIADYTLIGAGAYVSHNTSEYDVYVPERSIKLNKNSLDMNI